MRNSSSRVNHVQVDFRGLSDNIAVAIAEHCNKSAFATEANHTLQGVDFEAIIDGDQHAIEFMKGLNMESHYRTTTATAQTDGRFWMVTGKHNKPTVRHNSQGVAEAEAKRLALQHPGTEFYVLEAKIRYRVPTVERKTL